MANDVNIQIGLNADLTALQKLDAGYQAVLTNARKVYQEISSPITAVADKAASRRGLDELNRKATEIEQKIARTRLDQLQQPFGPQVGPSHITQLRKDLERANLERQVRQFDVAESGRGMLPVMMGGGRFVAGKALKYGGAVAGLMGAYSLFSGVAGEMGTAEERNRKFAMSVSTMRGRTPFDYGDVGGFYEVKDLLKSIGDTAFMTAKDMLPFVDVMNEATSVFSEGGTKIRKEFLTSYRDVFAVTANIGKSLGVESPILSGFLVQGMRERAADPMGSAQMATMLMLNQNMTHRATEAIQAMQQVMTGTIHGTQGLGGFGMFNMMQTMNESQFRAYRGTGGAQAMLRLDQAFRGGGNENLQYFQAMALNPAFQAENTRRLGAFNAITGETRPNYGTGRYDQIISDVFKELGAFSTASDAQRQMLQLGYGGVAQYIGEKYKGSMGKMNIERLYDQYRMAYGDTDEGRRLLMTSQMTKDLGVSFTDVGVLGDMLGDPEFLKRASEKGLDLESSTSSYRAWKEAGGKLPEMEEYMQKKTTSSDHLQAIARDIKAMSDKMLPTAIRILSKVESFTSQTASAVESVVDIFTISGERSTEGGLSGAFKRSLFDISDPGRMFREASLRDIAMYKSMFSGVPTPSMSVGPEAQSNFDAFFKAWGDFMDTYFGTQQVVIDNGQ